MQKKGQLFSLDFLLAMALVILVIGIALKFSAQFTFDLQEKQEQLALEQAGQTAAMLLLSNPAITCTMVDSTGNALHPINNCIHSQADSIQNTDLGLSEKFDARVCIEGGSCLKNAEIPATAKHLFRTTVSVVLKSNGTVTKGDVYNCLEPIYGACLLRSQKIELAVWPVRET